MKWMSFSQLLEGFKIVASAAVNGLGSSMEAVGTVACVAGGAGFAFSNFMGETVNAGYYGAVGVNGIVNFDARVYSMNLAYSQTVPFSQNLINTSAGRPFFISDYLNSATVRWTSTVVILSGSTLRLLGANLKNWQKGQDDVEEFKVMRQAELAKPVIIEYLYVSAESLNNSLTLSAFSFLFSEKIIEILLSYLGKYKFTFPLHGNKTISVPNYQGPIGTKQFPLDFYMSQNKTVEIEQFLKVLVNVKVNASALTDVNYGAGLFFEPNNNKFIPLEVCTAVVSIAALAAAGFFSKQVKRLRDDRVLESKVHNNYLNVQI